MADRSGLPPSSHESHSSGLGTLDPRALLLMTVVFVVGVVSVHSVRPDRLLPFLAIPLFLTLSAGLPLSRVLMRTAAALPFAFLLGLAALLSDDRPVTVYHGVTVHAGLLMGSGVVLKTVLTVWMAVLLVRLATFPSVTRAAGKLGLPKTLVQTMFFLYRYLHDMIGQVRSVIRSHRLRSGGRRRMSVQTVAAVTSALLAASLNQGGRVGRALEIRGFNGRLPEGAPLRFSMKDSVALGLMTCVVVIFRLGFDRIIQWAGVS